MLKKEEQGDTLKIRKPQLSDGSLIHDLVSRSPPLDVNSLYSYLLICAHFNHTSAVAEYEEKIVGYISAYIPPQKEDTLFIWQVAVQNRMRSRGVAKKMIINILRREEMQEVKFIETTVSPENDASRALFNGVASHLGTHFSESAFFTRELFADSGHPEEFKLKIGPFSLKRL